MLKIIGISNWADGHIYQSGFGPFAVGGLVLRSIEVLRRLQRQVCWKVRGQRGGANPESWRKIFGQL